MGGLIHLVEINYTNNLERATICVGEDDFLFSYYEYNIVDLNNILYCIWEGYNHNLYMRKKRKTDGSNKII